MKIANYVIFLFLLRTGSASVASHSQPDTPDDDWVDHQLACDVQKLSCRLKCGADANFSCKELPFGVTLSECECLNASTGRELCQEQMHRCEAACGDRLVDFVCRSVDGEILARSCYCKSPDSNPCPVREQTCAKRCKLQGSLRHWECDADGWKVKEKCDCETVASRACSMGFAVELYRSILMAIFTFLTAYLRLKCGN